MHGHDDVELPEHGVGERETAVLECVHLRTLENRETRAGFVERIDLIDLLRQSTGIQPMGHADVLGVIGDGDTAQASCARRGYHLR